MAAPLPFSEPALLSAKRVHGIVTVPQEIINSKQSTESPVLTDEPPSLTRKDSQAGSILVPSSYDKNCMKRAFSLQRKISKTKHGACVRIGIVLEPKNSSNNPPHEDGGGGDADNNKNGDSDGDSDDDSENDNQHVPWQVLPNKSKTLSSQSTLYPYEMVAIKVMDKTKVMNSKGTSKDLTVELSALQTVANFCKNESSTSTTTTATTNNTNGKDTNHDYYDENLHDCHVVCTREILADSSHIYMVMPYHGDGSLFQYVQEFDRLEEKVARYFFKQILKGLQTLQKVGICHRGLSLQNVLLRGTHCTLMDLSNAIRMKPNSSVIEPQITIGGGNPQYMAPELLQNESFDGYAIDLWAAGVMLFAMLFGNKAPFVLAAPDDKRFRKISINRNLETYAQQVEAEKDAEPSSNKRSKNYHVSCSAINLIQSMLSANPEQRLTLQQVLDHPWVVESDEDADVVPLPLPSTVNVMMNGD